MILVNVVHPVYHVIKCVCRNRFTIVGELEVRTFLPPARKAMFLYFFVRRLVGFHDVFMEGIKVVQTRIARQPLTLEFVKGHCDMCTVFD